MATIGPSIILAVVASLLIARGIWGWRRLSLISSWPAADATVIASGLDDLPPMDCGLTHRPKLTYSHAINGKTYRSSRLGITPDAFDIFSQESAQAFVARYPAGSRFEIRVSPTDPLFSVVVDEGATSRKRNHFLTLAISGGLLICCDAALVYVA